MIICLDIDGTLIDSTKRHCVLLETLLHKSGILPPNDDRHKYLDYKREGNSTRDYCKNVLHLTDALSAYISNEWIAEIELPFYLNMDILYPDTIRFLEYLKNTQHTVVYLTARTNDIMFVRELTKLGIFEYAADIFVVDPNETLINKLKIVKRFMIENDVCMVGDTEIEAKISQLLNIKSFILNRGFRSKNFLERHGFFSYNSLDDILSLI